MMFTAHRVTNGVNLDRFSSAFNGTEALLQQRLNLDGDPIYLTVGGIEPRKNSIVLLQAFAQILKCLPDSQLVIAGGATLFDYQAYRDAFLFPSITEGWGLVVLEAIASGLPVVTANRPPFTEFLTCEQAFLVNPESAEEIADAAILAIQDIAQPLIDRSQSLCLQYNWENSAKMHVKYYTQLG
jgi:glycosyltransferase involved in cell wall biosynthesis